MEQLREIDGEEVIGTAAERKPKPISLAPAMFTGEWREMTCPNCMNTFVQHRLSERFKKWIAAFGPHLEQLWNSRVGEGLPLYCIPCERNALGDRNRPPVKPTRLGGYVE